MLVAFLAYRDQFSQRVGNLIGSWFKLRMLNVQTDRLSDIVLAEPERMVATSGGPRDEPPAFPTLIPASGRLEARGISVRYGADEPWVLRDVALSIRAGTSYAITGPSGCGKTTLIKVLMGLLPANEGTVEIDGRDLKLIGGEAYRRRIAGVMQNDGLFAGSIAENIACFDDRPDLGWVEECAARAAMLDHIRATPMGFETLVGDMGSTLSGGQKQRIILARALYRRPEILFLDEATSHLDEPTEAVIVDALKDLAMTRVIIAHRPATIAHAQEVLAMDASATG